MLLRMLLRMLLHMLLHMLLNMLLILCHWLFTAAHAAKRASTNM
jgi:hypothetical protein